ncbi:unnamed protein product, partial [Meganyctiphanes norvegica]
GWKEKKIDGDSFSSISSCKLELKEIDNKILTLCFLRSLHDISKCCNNILSLIFSIKSQGFTSLIATTCNFIMIDSPPEAKKTVKFWLDFKNIYIIVVKVVSDLIFKTINFHHYTQVE